MGHLEGMQEGMQEGIKEASQEALVDKLTNAVDRLSQIESKLDRILHILERQGDGPLRKMEDHVDFVESVFSTFSLPRTVFHPFRLMTPWTGLLKFKR